MTTPTTIVRPPNETLRSALRLATVFALLRLLLQFALTIYTSHLGYGYFRDEFYYIACGRHLAWGYVDHGPLVAIETRVGETLFGDSVFALRILPAVAGAVTVFLTGLLGWVLGGRRAAQSLAMFAVSLAPCYLALDGFLSMNCWEPVFWMTATIALVRLVRGGSPRLWWTVIGVSCGLGLLNKPSISFFLVVVTVGLLCTPQRRILFTPWAGMGVALMIAIELPNVIWQMHHQWATLDFLHQVANGKNTPLSPLGFFGAQLIQLHPLTALIWLTGLVALLANKSIRNMRWLGIAYLLFLPLMWRLHAKDYYLAPFYPVLFAAGGVAWESRFARTTDAKNRLFAFPVLESALLVVVGLALPMASPVLRPDAWLRYTAGMHFRPKDTERDKSGALPQFYADRFGWDEIVGKMAAAYDSLSPGDRAQACLVTENYGEAAALDFLGQREHLGLPPAITGHNNYWIWGPHGCTRKVVILISRDTPEELAVDYRSVQVVGHIDDPWIMPYEHKNIYILHDRKSPYDWSQSKHFD
jgi:hypothetical protein